MGKNRGLRIRDWSTMLPLGELGSLPQANLATNQTVCHQAGRTRKAEALLTHPKSGGIREEPVPVKSYLGCPLTGGNYLAHLSVLIIGSLPCSIMSDWQASCRPKE